MLKAIENIEPSNVLQIVTDNAKNCQVAGEEIEKIHKHIFWSPCVCHTSNLIFKYFASALSWLRDTYKARKNIVKYYINHTHILVTFRAHSKLKLLKIAKTIFASHYTLLTHLFHCREQLITTICLSKRKNLVKNVRFWTKVADTIKKEDFWDEVKNTVQITKPLFLLIKFCDWEE